MATQVASLFATLTLDDNQFRTNLGLAGTGLSGLGGKITQVGGQITLLGGTIQAAIRPLVNFGTTGISVAAAFQESMVEIAARTGLTGEAMEQISDFAQEMARTSVFSAQQMAEAFLDLLTSGQNVEEAIATLPFVIDAAAASGEELGQTADLLTDIMAAFGLPVTEAESVVNSLARAAASSSADMASLGQGFQNVGPVARLFGLSVDETAAALAILAENGIKGAEAGTALKSMLLGVTRDTERTQGAWDELGISLFDGAGAVRDMDTVIGELEAAMNLLPMQDQIRLSRDLGGSYGIMALESLSAGQSIGEMREMMEGQASAAEIADARMNTFNQRMASLGGSIENLQIAVFTPFIEDVLQPLAERGIEVVNMLTVWAQQNPETASTVIKVVTAVALLSTGLITAGLAISAIGTAVGFIISPFLIFIATVALLVIGANALAQALGFESVFELFREGWENLVEVVELSERILSGIFDVIKTALTTAFETAATFATEKWGEIIEAFENSPQTFVDVMNLIKDAILLPFETAATFVEAFFADLTRWIGNIDLGILEDVAGTIGDIISGIGGIAGDVGGFLGGIIPGAEGVNFQAGQTLDVGERGPETVRFSAPGTVLPNERSGGGDVNITVIANDEAGGHRAAAAFKNDIGPELEMILNRNG